MSPHKLVVRHEDLAVAVEVSPGGHATIDGEAYEVWRVRGGEYRVRRGERVETVFVAGSAESRWVAIGGRAYEVEVAREGRERRRAAAGRQDALSAPMPATVIAVEVTPGQAVRQGETLLMLEAMKMEMPIRAPQDGIVRAIHCEPGELVQPGMRLVEMDPATC